MSFEWNGASDDENDSHQYLYNNVTTSSRQQHHQKQVHDGDDDLNEEKQEETKPKVSVQEKPSGKGRIRTITSPDRSRRLTLESSFGDSVAFLEHSHQNTCNDDIDNDDDDDDDDEVDWEDADETIFHSPYEKLATEAQPDRETVDDDDQKLPPRPAASLPLLRPVTLDLEENEDKKTDPPDRPQRAKRRRRQHFRWETLPASTQSLLTHLHQAHLLGWICYATQISAEVSFTTHSLASSTFSSWSSQHLLSPPEILAVARSLVPESWLTAPPARHRTGNAKSSASLASSSLPTARQLEWFAQQFFALIHQTAAHRREQERRNRALGAPLLPHQVAGQRRRVGGSRPRSQQAILDTIAPTSTFSPSQQRQRALLAYAEYLSPSRNQDPQLWRGNGNLPDRATTASSKTGRKRSASASVSPPPRDQADGPERRSGNASSSALSMVQLLLAMFRSLQWRARLVMVVDPMPLTLTVDHPLLVQTTLQPLFSTFMATTKRSGIQPPRSSSAGDDLKKEGVASDSGAMLCWVEVLGCHDQDPNRMRWYHVDPVRQLWNRPEQVEALWAVMKTASGQPSSSKLPPSNIKKRRDKSATLAFVLAVEHGPPYEELADSRVHLQWTDVTPRYSSSWVDTLRQRGILHSGKTKTQTNLDDLVRTNWWSQTLNKLNLHFHADSLPSRENSPRHLMAAAASFISSGASPHDAIPVDEDSCDGKVAMMPPEEPNGEVEANGAQLGPQRQKQQQQQQIEEQERRELQQSAANEALPTSKAAYATHPVYALASQLGSTQVLAPDAKQRACGVFKGELVYRRSDVSVVRPARQWLYQGRQVRAQELSRPVKRQAKRRKPPAAVKSKFQVLSSYGVGQGNDGSLEQQERERRRAQEPLDEGGEDDGKQDLYAVWQTDPWSPTPIGPNDALPVHDQYRNIELALLNPGLVHIDLPGVAPVAKALGVPYAPCLLGFENGQGGLRVPTVRGIVVHEHNAALIREAAADVESHAMALEQDQRRQNGLRLWKRLMTGILTEERLRREYQD